MSVLEDTDPRAELERLRKMKRLRELEAKAEVVSEGGPKANPMIQVPGGVRAMTNAEVKAKRKRDMEFASMFGGAPKMTSAAAFADNFVNAATFGNAENINTGLGNLGIGPQFVDQRKGERAMRGHLREEAPGSSIAGELLGYLGPGAGLFRGGAAALRAAPGANAFAQSVGQMGRLPSYVGRLTGLAAVGAADAGVYGATVGASNESAETGEDPTVQSRARTATEFATHPLSIAAGPAASLGGRGLNFMRTGSATPTDVAARVQQSIGRPTNQTGTLAEIFDLDVVDPSIRPEAVKRVVRTLKDGGLAVPDIPRAFEAARGLQTAGDGLSERLTFGQALTQVLERDFPQAADNIVSRLRERRLTTRNDMVGGRDRSPGIAGAVTDDLRGSQSDFLLDSADRAFGGSGRRITAEDAAEAYRKAVGSEYEPILDQGQVTDGLVDVLNGPGMGRLREPLDTIASGEGLSLDQFIAADPLRAAHWMQHAAYRASQSDDAVFRNAYTALRQRILNELEDAVPGYRELRGRFGDAATADELDGFGRLFARAVNDQGELDKVLRKFEELPEAAQDIARLQIRDHVKGLVGKSQAGDRAARTTTLTTENMQTALRQMGGDRFADDLMGVRRENEFLSAFDPNINSRTALNLQSMANAGRLGDGTRTRAAGSLGDPGTLAGDAVISGATGTFAPVLTAKKQIGNLFGKIAQPRKRTLEDETRLLLSRPGNVPPRPPRRADFSQTNAFRAPGAATATGAALGGAQEAQGQEGGGSVNPFVGALAGGLMFAGGRRAAQGVRSRLPKPVQPPQPPLNLSETPLYRGMNAPYEPTRSGGQPQWFSTSPDVANFYSGVGDGANVMKAAVRAGKSLEVDIGGQAWGPVKLSQIRDPELREALRRAGSEKFPGAETDTDQIARIGKELGYKTIVFRNMKDPYPSDVVAVLDNQAIEPFKQKPPAN
ncbi:MAG: hypothetical protein AAFQ67_02740 [Pseudomonadota bacterium]